MLLHNCIMVKFAFKVTKKKPNIPVLTSWPMLCNNLVSVRGGGGGKSMNVPFPHGKPQAALSGCSDLNLKLPNPGQIHSPGMGVGIWHNCWIWTTSLRPPSLWDCPPSTLPLPRNVNSAATAVAYLMLSTALKGL